MTGDTIQIATPSSSAPKNRFTPTISGPDFGSSAPSVVPMTMSGTPIPSASEKSAAPPRRASRVWLM